MSQPTASAVHVNAPLTSILIARMLRAPLMADRMFPIVPVDKQSDRYFVYDKGDWLRDDAKERAPSTESAGGGWDIDNTPTYSCRVFAFHKDIDDQIRGNADMPIDMDRDGTLFVGQKLSIRREKQWAQRFFTTGIWTGSTTGGDITPGTLWSASGSTPIADITAQLNSVEKKSGGYRPNVIGMGAAVFEILKDHPDFTDRIKYNAGPTSPAVVTVQAMAAVLGVDRIEVGRVVETTSAEGAADTFDYILGKNLLCAYAAPEPSILMPSAGYQFVWKGLLGSMGSGHRVKKFRMEQLESDRVEGEGAWDMKQVAPECGAFFLNPIA